MPPIKHFPDYVFALEGCDAPCVELSNDEFVELIHLFATDQQAGLKSAFIFCEENILSKADLKDLTAPELEQFIKQINRRVANSLITLNAAGYEGGVYNINETYISKQSSIPGTEFEGGQKWSANDQFIIQSQFGSAAAQRYQAFFQTLELAQDKLVQEGQLAKQRNDLAKVYQLTIRGNTQLIAENKLENHPGYEYYKKATRIIPASPTANANTMRGYCENIIALTNKIPVDPIRVAAAVLQLAYIHPFYDGNGRTSRIICNTFLMGYGIEPINFMQNINEFYLAVENLPQDPDSLYKYLTKKTKEPRPVVVTLVSEMTAFYSQLAGGDVYSLPSKYVIKQSYSTQVVRTLDADYCSNKANQYSNRNRLIALFYTVRAGDFYLADNKKEQAADRYLQAAKLCRDLNNYDSTYVYAKRSQALVSSKTAQDLMEQFKFVHAAKLVAETSPTVFTTYKTQDVDLAFRRAAHEGMIKDMEELLAKKANINGKGEKSGKTALHVAYESNKTEAIKFLIEKGADQTILDQAGKKPSDYALPKEENNNNMNNAKKN